MVIGKDKERYILLKDGVYYPDIDLRISRKNIIRYCTSCKNRFEVWKNKRKCPLCGGKLRGEK